MNKLTLLLFLIGLIVFFNSCFDRQNYMVLEEKDDLTFETIMERQLENTLKNVNDSINLAFRGEEISTSQLIKNFYAINQYVPAWTYHRKPNRFAREMMKLFARSAYYGLDTSFYQFSSLSELYQQLNEIDTKDRNEKATEFEILMTHNCLKIMSHIQYGITQPDTSIYGYQKNPYPGNLAKKLVSFINEDLLTEGILDLQPKSYEYRFLQAGLEQFLKKTELNNDTFQISIHELDSAKTYEATKAILTANNYYKKPEDHVNIFTEYAINDITVILADTSIIMGINIPTIPEDTAFYAALKRFQKSHGLHQDGLIGNNTKNALILNNKDRFKQIAINLERLRWEKRRPEKYVYVNIPAYKLRVLDKGWIKKTFRVVVGAVGSKTPELNSQIEYFITNPHWNVPSSIASREILPKIQNDSNYLIRNNYLVLDENRQPISEKIDWSQVNSNNFNYFIRQSSGSGNALGNIKFIFPNPYHVYIHDTQDKSKFNKEIRAYSHGCMRIENPLDLINYLVDTENDVSTDSLNVWISNRLRKQVNLSQPVPVFVRYITCEADKNANITFYKDIYGKDKNLKEKLFAVNDL